MKSYKVKINCPMFTKNDTFVTDELGFIYVNNVAFEPTFYPDVFKEIKEPLFVTEDGVNIYINDPFYAVIKSNLKLDYHDQKEETGDKYRFIASAQTQINDFYIYFSTKEAAEKYIDENKLIFSKKQLREAIGDHHAVLVDDLKTKLNL